MVEWPAPGRIGVMPRPAGGQWLTDDLMSLREAGVDTIVSALTEPERQRLDLIHQCEVAEKVGLSYVAFPIDDFGIPGIAEIRLLAKKLAAEVTGGRFVVAHCFGGIGRSGTIAGATLIQLGATADHAMELISRARGIAAPETKQQRDLLHRLSGR